MMPQLHVLLGAGGVGKTTLAAAYALALARSGGRVGLLGIDPARRLQGALGLTLPDLEIAVPGAGELRAALLRPADSLRRWAVEACPDPEQRARLTANPFFVALADRLASSTDTIAAIRLAEWTERDPALTHLVVDTAPGLNAIEFLARAEKLAAFLEGRLVGGLRWLAEKPRRGPVSWMIRGGARRVLGRLARIVGTRMLLELAEFVSLTQGVLTTMLERLERTRRWLREDSTEILTVTTVREDAVHGVRQLAEALGHLGLAPTATVVNRALPSTLATELGALDLSLLAREPAAVVRYARAYAAMQSRVVQAVTPFAPILAFVPAARDLEEDGHLGALAALGDLLRVALCQRPLQQIAAGQALVP